MPKVLRIINRFNIGGPTYNAAYLTKYLSSEYETLLVGGLKDKTEESSEYILKNLGLNYKIIPEMKRSINPFNDIIAYKKIQSIINDFKPDIVHTHAAKAGALGRRAAYTCKVPVIIHTFHGHVFHSYFGNFKSSIYKNIERNLAKKSNAIIAISDKQKEELTKIHNIAPANKIEVIPLGFDLQRFNDNLDKKRVAYRNHHQLSDDTIAIGIVGRLVSIKNHKLFINAINYVKQNTSKPICAIIIGDGEERPPIASQIDELGLQSFVKMVSWEKEVEKVYPALDIVCLTSFNEGTPVSLIEAQAANVPIVSTNVGGIENVVKKNDTALLADINDESTFYNHLLELVNNDSKRKAMKKNGWSHVKDKFHYTRLVRDMEQLYNRLLNI